MCVDVCVRACVRVCILMNNKVNLVKEPSLVFYNVPLSILILSLFFFFCTRSLNNLVLIDIVQLMYYL